MKINKKYGFTLIELLAVILILGIIALIAIPTVNSVLSEARLGAFESTLNNVSKKVEEACNMELIKGEELTSTYTINNGKSSPSLELKGELPNGTITVDNDCRITYSLSNSNYIAKKTNVNEDVVISKKDQATSDKNLIKKVLTKVNLMSAITLIQMPTEQLMELFLQIL